MHGAPLHPRGTFGEDVPYARGLDRGFPFRGRRPYLNRQKGIHRASVQQGPAALSIQTSANSRYDDEILADGFAYAYRVGSIDQPALRGLLRSRPWSLRVMRLQGHR